MSKSKSIGIRHMSLGKNPDADNRINLRSVESSLITHDQLSDLISNKEMGLICVTDDEAFPINVLKFKSKYMLIVEPNPITFYYSLLNMATASVANARKELKKYFAGRIYIEPSTDNDLVIFSFLFRFASMGVIFAFSSIEAMLNQLIPDDYIGERKGKLLTKENIQRYTSFDEKLYVLIPQITGKDYFKKYPAKKELMQSLSRLRNDLIHLKHNSDRHRCSYTGIYQAMLDVDLEKYQKFLKHLLNYYQKDLIIETPDMQA